MSLPSLGPERYLSRERGRLSGTARQAERLTLHLTLRLTLRPTLRLTLRLNSARHPTPQVRPGAPEPAAD